MANTSPDILLDRNKDVTQPARKLFSITPNDSTELVNCRAIWVGGAGNVAIVARDDSSAVTVVGVAAGTLLPIMCKKVMSTNTTATNIIGLY